LSLVILTSAVSPQIKNSVVVGGYKCTVAQVTLTDIILTDSQLQYDTKYKLCTYSEN